jgi:DNA-binding MarR family transcriptional regulator
MLTRARRHEMITAAAGVPLDRAAVVILRELSAAGEMRIGELANALRVEPSHVTRQVQKLTRAGYVKRIPDPSDSRAQIIAVTSSGKAASKQVTAQARQGILAALAHWTPSDLHQLATLLERMLGDLAAHSDRDAPLGVPGRRPPESGPCQ